MRLFLLTLALPVLACGCSTSGKFLTADQKGWFNVSGDSYVDFMYCTAADEQHPRCYIAATVTPEQKNLVMPSKGTKVNPPGWFEPK